MIGISIKRISVLHLCHVLKPFVKSTPVLDKFILRVLIDFKYFVEKSLSRSTSDGVESGIHVGICC